MNFFKAESCQSALLGNLDLTDAAKWKKKAETIWVTDKR